MPDDDEMEDLAHTDLGKIMSECCIRKLPLSRTRYLGVEADYW